MKYAILVAFYEGYNSWSKSYAYFVEDVNSYKVGGFAVVPANEFYKVVKVIDIVPRSTLFYMEYRYAVCPVDILEIT